MDNQTNSRYDIILGRDLLNALGLDLNFSSNIIIGGDGPYEGCSASMDDLINYEFKPLTEKIDKLEESFINSYVNKCHEFKSTIISTRKICSILNAKYEKANLNKFMT